MRIKFRPLLYLSVFALLLLFAGYASIPRVIGQTVPTGQITVTKEHLQHSTKSFEFEIAPADEGHEVEFNLKDGESNTVSVPPGSYTIREEASGTNALININCGAGGTVPNPGGTVPGGNIDLLHHRVKVMVTGGSSVNCTFQNSQAVRIRVRKYKDVNGNGTRNRGEKYLKNWVITVFDSTGSIVVAHPKKTNRYGRVKFESLPPGAYVVCESLRSGWINTQPSGASPCHAVTLAAGEEARLLFGNRRTTVESASQVDSEEVYTSDADMAVDPALADGVEIVDNPDEVYGPEWDDAPDATQVYNLFMPYVGR